MESRNRDYFWHSIVELIKEPFMLKMVKRFGPKGYCYPVLLLDACYNLADYYESACYTEELFEDVRDEYRPEDIDFNESLNWMYFDDNVLLEIMGISDPVTLNNVLSYLEELGVIEYEKNVTARNYLKPYEVKRLKPDQLKEYLKVDTWFYIKIKNFKRFTEDKNYKY